MLRLLIADASEEFCLALTDELMGAYEIQCCHEGKEALEILHAFRPEVLVLDMLLSGLDGITLLHRAAGEGLTPMVLATTRLLNDYVLDSVDSLGVGYMMVKPCDIKAVAERLADLSGHLKPAAITKPDPSTLVINTLLKLGVPANRRGFACLKEAVLLVMEEPGQQITKSLYPAVAKRVDGNDKQVERAIRSCIVKAWEQRDETVWRQYFHCDKNGDLIRPSNGAFVSMLAGHISVELASNWRAVR